MALQILLDMVHQYAQKWRYQLNGMKSVVMVFGEAARTREHERTLRLWRLGESVLKEVNEQHHLGILRSVANTTLARTNELIYQLVTAHSCTELGWVTLWVSSSPDLTKTAQITMPLNYVLQLRAVVYLED